MSNYAGTKESNLQSTTTMAIGDFIRTVIGGVSARMTLTNLAAQISPLISSSVLKSKVRSISTSTGILITDNTLLVDCTSGNITTSLPSPASAWDATNTVSNTFTVVQKIDAGNSLTVTPNSGESIYVGGTAQSSVVLTNGAQASFETDGTDWIVVSS